jgi:SlyX protein
VSGGMVDQSIEEIETKIAYLEHAIGELSDVVLGQQREIRALKAEIDQLRDRLEAAQEEERPAGPELERPPHY